jgi:hypothetical protein
VICWLSGARPVWRLGLDTSQVWLEERQVQVEGTEKVLDYEGEVSNLN